MDAFTGAAEAGITARAVPLDKAALLKMLRAQRREASKAEEDRQRTRERSTRALDAKATLLRSRLRDASATGRRKLVAELRSELDGVERQKQRLAAGGSHRLPSNVHKAMDAASSRRLHAMKRRRRRQARSKHDATVRQRSDAIGHARHTSGWNFSTNPGGVIDRQMGVLGPKGEGHKGDLRSSKGLRPW